MWAEQVGIKPPALLLVGELLHLQPLWSRSLYDEVRNSLPAASSSHTSTNIVEELKSAGG